MNWYKGPIPEAVAEVRTNKKMLLVYIEGPDEMSQKMTSTYNNPKVTEKLSSGLIIALKLVAGSFPYTQFHSAYPVLVIPSSFFIGADGNPIEIITGSLAPSDFCNKVDKLLELYNNDCKIKGEMNPNKGASMFTEVDINQGASTSAEADILSSSVPASKSSSSEHTASQTPSLYNNNGKVERAMSPNESASISTEADINKGASTSSKADVPSSSVPESEFSTSEPITSQNSSAETSSQSIEEKVERAKLLLEAQRQSKALEEKENEKARELERRNMGKAMQQAQKTKHENELREWAKDRAKEKEEERLAKEKVKQMIAQDRAERAAKYQRTKEAEQAERERLARNREEAERAMRNAAMSSNDARIQFRLPDGSYTTHCFSADASLEEARRFVIEEVQPPFSNFTLCTTFPRRHFTESNYSETLRDLQLAPSAVLLILPSQAVSSVKQGTGFLSSLFWMAVSPLVFVWNLLWSLLPGRSQESNPPPPTPSTSTTQASTNPTSDNRQANVRRRESPFAKREGNIFRINNQSDDDDENNTWNGNSTQQM